jgi:hypothetical protein
MHSHTCYKKNYARILILLSKTAKFEATDLRQLRFITRAKLGNFQENPYEVEDCKFTVTVLLSSMAQ